MVDTNTFDISRTTLQKRKVGRAPKKPPGRSIKKDRAQINALSKSLDDNGKRDAKRH